MRRCENGGGAGKTHVHAGLNWGLEDAIGQRSESVVTFLNMGASGTTTEDGETPNGFPNGNNSRRLAAARQLQPDVVVIEYCINDLDTPHLHDNLVRMIEALRSPQTDIVVLGCPGFPNFRSIEHWRHGEEAARLAAESTDAAFVPFAPIMAPEHAGATGLARRTRSTTGINHPGTIGHLGVAMKIVPCVWPSWGVASRQVGSGP